MVAGGLLDLPNIILVGDLNFTISSSKIWGQKDRIDPLTSYFSHLISSNNLVDLCLSCPGPTWRNGRTVEEGISKIIDRFLSSALHIPSLAYYRSCASPSEVSDHYPICLEWGHRPVLL